MYNALVIIDRSDLNVAFIDGPHYGANELLAATNRNIAEAKMTDIETLYLDDINELAEGLANSYFYHIEGAMLELNCTYEAYFPNYHASLGFIHR